MTRTPPTRPLWRCPKCRRTFANRNQADACGRHDLAHLARRLEHPRFRRIETISARNHVHHSRLERLDDVDSELRAWLSEAYAVGEQKHLGER